MSEIRFDGRVAVITGAGGGLGKTYAKLIAARGGSVVVNDLGGAADGTGGSSSMADETVKEIEEAGGKAVANYDSVATPEGGEAIIQTALDNFEKVDIVINNAGILRDKSFVKLEPENLEAVIDVHLKGAFFVSQPAFRVMKEHNYGRFLFTASGAGIFGNFGQTNYGAAKMGLVGLSNVLSVEGAKNNIKCNAIAPIAKTRLTEQLLGAMAEHLDAEYVTPLVAYLVSEQCDVTHEIFDVGAGRYARVFLGMAPGWTTPDAVPPSPEDIAANLDEIRATDGFTIPDSIAGEMQAVMEALKARG
ncbi:MAG: SDR family oxidoreductase [Myxococcota bacterium]|jgi:NAD(P)-dependent dehydrogenase (short-subunit alcohol dehydrogenase family)|nr:short-chain dehydrogenase [Deltaproteobacteria bacterium]MCP4241805.1 SDR family oxidoreductase [bacterium]MDP6074154.1 SDR family oxidoreductase [Myxococcota bacterium]MDP6241775.1 SDR family oxidoreductase [Myxococcota bacterium]MDP7074589.1 SDR family oxidoreductase [Myxococcota bacterium]